MHFNEQLLVDSCYGSSLAYELHESKSGLKLVKFRGKFQEAEAVNKNKRMYPFGILDENVKSLQEAIKDRRLIGELDHPTDSIVHYANCSHLITKLWWDGNTLMGEGEILPTPSGRILECLLGCGIKIGMSSRGVGNGATNEDGILVIGEGYKLITFDAVADPSTYAAFQERAVSKDEAVVRTRIVNSITKNECSGIDTVSKEALIACLSQIIKTQVEQI